jgi:hypothetical protein
MIVWRKWRTFMVLSNVASVFGISVHTVQTYSPTWGRARVWCNCVDGGGVGFGIDFKHLRKVKANVLIMFSSCKTSQSSPMYQRKQTWVS